MVVGGWRRVDEGLQHQHTCSVKNHAESTGENADVSKTRASQTISHAITPNDQTSDFSSRRSLRNVSGAIHRVGCFPSATMWW